LGGNAFTGQNAMQTQDWLDVFFTWKPMDIITNFNGNESF